MIFLRIGQLLVPVVLTASGLLSSRAVQTLTLRQTPIEPRISAACCVEIAAATPPRCVARMGAFRAQGAALVGTVDGMLRIVQQGDWDEQLRQAVAGLELSEVNRLVQEAARQLGQGSWAEIQAIVRDMASVADSLRHGDPVRGLFTASDRIGYNSPEIAATFLCSVVTKARAAAKNLPALRVQYEAEVRLLEDVGLNARAAGQTTEATARMLHAERNALKIKYRELSPPDKVKLFEQRNIREYGDPLGRSIDQLRAEGKSWEQIIESAAHPGGKDLGF